MREVSRWFRRIMTTLLCFLCVAWVFAEASQWFLRWEAQRLLGDLKSIQVGSTTLAEARHTFAKWRRWGTIQTGCHEGNESNCYFWVTFPHRWPQILRGSPDEGAHNWLARIIGRMGLRSSAVGAGVIADHGIVTRKSYLEEVDLPVRDWYLRGGAYVPTLSVSSEEFLRFSEHERDLAPPAHPTRFARRFKGPYGLGVYFTEEEAEPERANLMDFRFSCITQFFPCTNERDILPSGADLLDEDR